MAWKMMLNAEQLEEVRMDKTFAELLTLCRIANLLRATSNAGYAATETTAAHNNQRMSMMVLMAGLLAEAFKLLEHKKRFIRRFEKLDAFKTHMQPILDDTSLTEFRTAYLLPLRDKSVFHNDAVVSRQGLKHTPKVPATMVEGDSDHLGTVYYSLADFVVWRRLLPKDGKEEETSAAVLRLVLQTSMRLCLAIDALCAEMLTNRGIVVEQLESPS